MARGRQFWSWFDAVHPVNGTPYRALALLAGISIVVPCVMAGAGVSMANTMDYLMQIASLGFLAAYLLVCVAAPYYLATRGELRFTQIAAAVSAIVIIGAVLVMSLFPVPEGPSRYLPYIFAALLLFGMLASGKDFKRGAQPEAFAEASAAAELGDASE
jgi:amino acid transporter